MDIHIKKRGERQRAKHYRGFGIPFYFLLYSRISRKYVAADKHARINRIVCPVEDKRHIIIGNGTQEQLKQYDGPDGQQQAVSFRQKVADALNTALISLPTQEERCADH